MPSATKKGRETMHRKASKIILCPKCLTLQLATRHHIYPVRFFGDSINAPILHLCEKCHQALERIIPQYSELEPEDYLQITREFLAV